MHQEDFCQALGPFPRQKDKKDGGPGRQERFELMKKVIDVVTARTQLLDRAIFQYPVGNLDAHAKNYSLVYRLDRIGLGQLYNVNNAAAFWSFYKEQRPRLAMSVGGDRDPLTLAPENWEAFARKIDFRPRFVLRQLLDMAKRMIPAAEKLLADVKPRRTASCWRWRRRISFSAVQQCARGGHSSRIPSSAAARRGSIRRLHPGRTNGFASPVFGIAQEKD